MTEELSWEVYVDDKGRIEIPSAYVVLSEIPEGESFNISLGIMKKTIRLVAEGNPAAGWGDQYVKRESDGAMILKYLTETNENNRDHAITEEYTRMINCCEGERYEVKVGKKQIRLTYKG